MSEFGFTSKARLLKLFLLATGLLAGLFASAGMAQADKVVVVDDRGKEITIPQPVTRVVVAGTPLYTEILVDIGALGLIVGVTDSPDNPPEVDDLPKVGDSLQPNIEEVIALEPDVVFGAIFGVRDQLEAAGIIVVTPVSFITKIPDTFKVIRDLGKIVDHVAQAELLIGQISEAVVDVESIVAQEERMSTAFLFAFSSESPPFAVGKGSVEGELIARAGGRNLFGDVDGGNVVSFEAVIERDPDFIFTDPSQIKFITENALLSDVSAVKNGRVFGISASSLTSTRIAETLQKMALALHPSLFTATEKE